MFPWTPTPLRGDVGHVRGAGLYPVAPPLFVGRGRELGERLLTDDLVALLAADDLKAQARVIVPRHHVDSHEPRLDLERGKGLILVVFMDIFFFGIPGAPGRSVGRSGRPSCP